MNLFLSFALFFLSPSSLFENGEVTLFGQSHYFPKKIFSQIVPATLEDAALIHHLSAQMPFIYLNEKKSNQAFLPFRTYDQYQRLLSNSSSEENQTKDLFLVFKDDEGRIQGYIHGIIFSFYKYRFKATIDEVVVTQKWDGKGIAKSLIGKFLSHPLVKKINQNSVSIVLREPFAKKMAQKFGIVHQTNDLDTLLILNTLLSRFSLAYLMQKTYHEVILHRKAIAQLKQLLQEAERLDHFSIQEAMEYLEILANKLYKKTSRNLTESKKSYYIGMQDDYLDLANVYFMMYILSSLFPKETEYSSDEPSQQEVYLQNVVNTLKMAQHQGGILPGDIQMVLGRLFAFSRFLSQENLQYDWEWVQKSIQEYLRLFGLDKRTDIIIVVFSSSLELAFREILWFSYSYEQAQMIAPKLNQLQKKLKSIKFPLGKKEKIVLTAFREIQEEMLINHQIILKPEFGLFFLYALSLYSQDQLAVHYKLGELFSLATFYYLNSIDVFDLVDKPARSIEPNEKGFHKKLNLTQAQKKRVRRILKFLFKPLNVKTEEQINRSL